jgi:N-acetylglucosamine malate deacetylase 1
MSDPVVVVAAHADDEVLGCGGTLALMARLGRPVHVLLVADGENSRSTTATEQVDPAKLAARQTAAQRAAQILGCKSVEQLGLPDNRLDTVALLDLVQHVERFISKHRPTTVLTHHAGDVNIDHRIMQDAVIAACRPQPGHSVEELLFFEVPSSTEWRPPDSGLSFNPTWFVDITDTLATKLAALDVYREEMRLFPHARSVEGVQALARWRGVTVGVEAAEAFVLGRKIIRKR